MSGASRDVVEREHRLDKVADCYLATIEELAGLGAVRDKVLHDVAEAAADVGIAHDDPEAKLLAGRLREIGLGD